MAYAQITALSHEFSQMGVNRSSAQFSRSPNQSTYSSDTSYTDFNFLVKPKVVNWIKAAGRIMFVMRGVPGSGKSTLVTLIQDNYPTACVCSADLFWIKPDGRYVHNVDRLGEAHNWAQERAEEACLKNQSPVIIDNTNIRRWECQKYINIAAKHDYLIIIVLPKTPWRFNVKELGARNKHNVPPNVIEGKLRDFEVAVPSFFGWFLSPADAQRMLKISTQYLDDLLSIPDFVNRFKWDNNAHKNMSLTRAWWSTNASHRLHVTVKYFPNTHKPSHSDINLVNSDIVQNAMGSVFPISIVGLVITGRTLSLRVVLCKETLKSGLWQMNPDNELPSSPLPIGSRCHITLGYTKGTRAVQTGDDLLDIAECELQDSGKLLAETHKGHLVYYKKSRFYLKFKNVIPLQAIFTGHY